MHTALPHFLFTLLLKSFCVWPVRFLHSLFLPKTHAWILKFIQIYWMHFLCHKTFTELFFPTFWNNIIIASVLNSLQYASLFCSYFFAFLALLPPVYHWNNLKPLTGMCVHWDNKKWGPLKKHCSIVQLQFKNFKVVLVYFLATWGQ